MATVPNLAERQEKFTRTVATAVHRTLSNLPLETLSKASDATADQTHVSQPPRKAAICLRHILRPNLEQQLP
jgi:hypothetical protein